MYDFKPDAALTPAETYRELLAAADALTADEPDAVANMANIAALIWEFLPDLNWAGFYRVAPAKNAGADELVLGPFVGRPACIRIPFGIGVCGAAAASGATQLVPDVHAFPGHIACDAASQSELVVPVVKNGAVVAVIDLDSPKPARFTPGDAAGIEALAALLSARI
jgi:GAF domain-containing protein